MLNGRIVEYSLLLSDPTLVNAQGDIEGASSYMGAIVRVGFCMQKAEDDTKFHFVFHVSQILRQIWS